MVVRLNKISGLIAGGAFTALSQLSTLPTKAQTLKPIPQNNLKPQTEKVTPDHLLKQSQEAQKLYQLLITIDSKPDQKNDRGVDLRVGPFESKAACEVSRQKFINDARTIWKNNGTVTIEVQPTSITSEFEDLTGRGGGSSLTVDQDTIPEPFRQSRVFEIPVNQQSRLNLDSLVCLPETQNRNRINP